MTDETIELPDEEPTPAPGDAADDGTIPPDWPEEDDPNEQEVL